MSNLDIELVEEMRELSMGYCTKCQDWTRDCTEPDASGYDCPCCGANSVIGAEEILFQVF